MYMYKGLEIMQVWDVDEYIHRLNSNKDTFLYFELFGHKKCQEYLEII